MPNHDALIRIDREQYVVNVTYMTGQQSLEFAGNCDSFEWMIFEKQCGEIKEIGPIEEVSFTTRGIEKFKTLPPDQTEGADAEPGDE